MLLVIKENILNNLQDGADINAALKDCRYPIKLAFLELEATKDSSEEYALTLFEELFALNMLTVIDDTQNINGNSSYNPSMIAWIKAISKNFNIDFLSNALQKLPNGTV